LLGGDPCPPEWVRPEVLESLQGTRPFIDEDEQ